MISERKALFVTILLGLAMPAYGHGGGGGGCGGHSVFCGVGWGNDGRPYESPPLNHDYKFGGYILKVPRRDFSVYIFENAGNLLAEFVSESISIEARKLPKSVISLQAGTAYCAPKGLSVIKSYRIRTSGGVEGVKTVYGIAGRGYSPREICYVYNAAGGGFVCFRARPINRYPDWTQANRLVTGSLWLDKKHG